ncbi:MAG: ABC transporter permease, partial [Bacteroidota bacterium]|nr:ABC transporter permease [Bacteroidota bacterium]
MRRTLEIIGSSFKMALQEFRANKLRTFLSLFGITVGIFCIISVLAVINSMEKAVKDDLNSIARGTVFIGKFENGGGPDYPWWKYVNRPEPTINEMNLIEKKIIYPSYVAYFANIDGPAEYDGALVTNLHYDGVTEGFSIMQSLTVAEGRNIEKSEYESGANVVLMGYMAAENLFGKAANAVGKIIKLKNDRPVAVVGVLPKKGSSILDAWDYDNALIMPYQVLGNIIPLKNAGGNIMVQAISRQVPMEALKDELTGIMRSLRRLNPGQDRNFSLNDIDSFSKTLDPIITGMNLGGWFIAGLSLIVGMFGVANIMFVTVKERTSQIGLKKALGAKRRIILTEFL